MEKYEILNSLKIELANWGMFVGENQSELRDSFDILFNIISRMDSNTQNSEIESQMGNVSSFFFSKILGDNAQVKLEDLLSNLNDETLPAFREVLKSELFNDPKGIVDNVYNKTLNLVVVMTLIITFILLCKEDHIDSSKVGRYTLIITACLMIGFYVNIPWELLKPYFVFVVSNYNLNSDNKKEEDSKATSVSVESHMADDYDEGHWKSWPYIVTKTILFFFFGQHANVSGSVTKMFVSDLIRDSNKASNFGDFIKYLVGSMTTLIGKVSEQVYGEKVFDWMKNEKNGLASAFMEKYEKFLLRIDRNGLEINIDVYNEIVDLFKECSELIRDIPNGPKTNGLKTNLIQCKSYLSKLREKLSGVEYSYLGLRQEPVCVLISGPPNIGKSFLIQEIISYLAPRVLKRDAIKKFLNNQRDRFVYHRESNSPYWDTYTKDSVFAVWDDFMQSVEQPGSDVSQTLEIIKCVNSAAFVLNMADVVDKGKHRFLSKFVLLNSNLVSFEPNNMIKDIDAFNRRLHIHVMATYNPDKCTKKSLDTGDPWKYELRPECVSRNERGETFINPDNIIFTLIQHKKKPKTGYEKLGQINFDTLCNMIYERYVLHAKYHQTNVNILDGRARKHYEMIHKESVEDLLSEDELYIPETLKMQEVFAQSGTEDDSDTERCSEKSYHSTYSDFHRYDPYIMPESVVNTNLHSAYSLSKSCVIETNLAEWTSNINEHHKTTNSVRDSQIDELTKTIKMVLNNKPNLQPWESDKIERYLWKYLNTFPHELKIFKENEIDYIDSIAMFNAMIFNEKEKFNSHKNSMIFFKTYQKELRLSNKEENAYWLLSRYFSQIVTLVNNNSFRYGGFSLPVIDAHIKTYSNFFDNRVKINLYVLYTYVYSKYGPIVYFPAFFMRMYMEMGKEIFDRILRMNIRETLDWMEENSLKIHSFIEIQSDDFDSELSDSDDEILSGKLVYKLPEKDVSAMRLFVLKTSKRLVKFKNWLTQLYDENSYFRNMVLFSKYALILTGVGLSGYAIFKLSSIAWSFLFANDFAQSHSVDHSRAIRHRESGKPKLRPKLFSKEGNRMNDIVSQMNPYADKQGFAILECIRRRNMWFLQRITSENKYVTLGSVLFVKGTTCVMPLHFAYKIATAVMKDNTKLNDKLRFIKMDKNGKEFIKFATYGEIIDGTRSMSAMEDRDLCLVSLPRHFPTAPNILKYIPTAEDLSNTREMDAVLTSAYGVPEMVLQVVTKAKLLTKEIDVGDHESNEYYAVATSFEYRAPTNKGDCGNILYIANKNLKLSKIFGLHVAGNSHKGVGYSAPLIREEIESLLDDVPYEQQVDYQLEEEFDGILNQSGKFGNYVDPIGKSRKRPKNQDETQISPSKISGVLSPPMKKPAQLKSFVNLLGERIDPWEKAIANYGVDECYVPKPIIDAARDSLKVFLDNNMKKIDYNYIRKFTIREAVCGIDSWEAFNRIDLTTSNGFPDNVLGISKRSIFGSSGVDFDRKEFGIFEKKINRHINDMSFNKRKFFVYFDNLKDELRPKQKVEDGKTRLFSCVNFELFILFRMYFGSFLAHFTDNAIDNSCAIGVNPYDPNEWNMIRRRLESFSDKDGNTCLDGDFAKFDGSQMSSIQWAIYDIIKEFYARTPHPDSDDQIRFILFNEITNSNHILLGEIYSWYTGMPSGNPLTALLNSLYNMMATRIAYIYAHKCELSSILHFDKNVWVIVLGDDVLMSVHPRKRHLFNPLRLSHLYKNVGMTFTSANKEDELTENFRKITEVTFLKRSWKWNEVIMNYVAPIAMETIVELPNWVTTSEKDINLLDRCNHAAKELSLHGKEIFEEGVKKMHNKLLEEIGTGLDSLNYEVTLRSVVDPDNPYSYDF